MAGDKSFDPRLESLRGIAALAVAWTHGQMVFAPSGYADPVLAFILSWTTRALPAGAAVILFFVLSGYVLGASLQRDSNYKRFVVRRFCRIFPAFWLSVIATFFLTYSLAPEMPAVLFSEWFNSVYARPSIADLFRNLVMAKMNVNAVAWTLIPEGVCSLLLPLLVFLHNRTNLLGHLAMLLLLVLPGWFSGHAAVQYMFCFYLGFFAPPLLAKLLTNKLAAIAASVIGLSAIYVGQDCGPYNSDMRTICAFGAAVLIAALISQPASWRWLNIAPLRFMGRISYSFYLLHLPVLFVLAYVAMLQRDAIQNFYVANFWIMLASLAGTALAAALSYRFVELPGIEIGRRLASSKEPPPALALSRTVSEAGS